QQMQACEPCPLAVRGKQRGRVLGLGATAQQQSAQLDPPEGRPEAAVVAAEAVQEERRNRPRPELPLTTQARGGGLRGHAVEPLEVERRRDGPERRRAPRGGP